MVTISGERGGQILSLALRIYAFTLYTPYPQALIPLLPANPHPHLLSASLISCRMRNAPVEGHFDLVLLGLYVKDCITMVMVRLTESSTMKYSWYKTTCTCWFFVLLEKLSLHLGASGLWMIVPNKTSLLLLLLFLLLSLLLLLHLLISIYKSLTQSINIRIIISEVCRTLTAKGIIQIR